jgi:hypothetical protein
VRYLADLDLLALTVEQGRTQISLGAEAAKMMEASSSSPGVT